MRVRPLLLLLMLAGCAARQSAAELATEDACERQANQLEDEQDRGRLIADDQSLSPFSSSGLPDDPSQGLSALYAHDQEVDGCVTKRTSSTTGGTTVGLRGRE